MELPERFMTSAIEAARTGIAEGQTPFGAVAVIGETVIASAHSTVWRDNDPTAHAEVNVIRCACKALKKIDLSDVVLFSTCEPCAMCIAAAHWARVSMIIFGARIADAREAGFSEPEISASSWLFLAKSSVQVVPGLLGQEAANLFLEWQSLKLCKPY